MENFKISKDIEFTDSYLDNKIENVKELNKFIKQLNKCFEKENNNFCEILVIIYKIKQLFNDYDKLYFGRFVSKNSQFFWFDDIMRNFGFDKTQSSRLLKCYEKFIEIVDSKEKIKDCFVHFSKSKLFELLTVDTEQLELDIKNKVLRYDMTVSSIREYVKNYQAIQKQKARLDGKIEEEKAEEIIEEDIPEAYNPKQHYEFNYFEEKTKAQLLNIIWELQKEYEKLKKEVKN